MCAQAIAPGRENVKSIQRVYNPKTQAVCLLNSCCFQSWGNSKQTVLQANVCPDIGVTALPSESHSFQIGPPSPQGILPTPVNFVLPCFGLYCCVGRLNFHPCCLAPRRLTQSYFTQLSLPSCQAHSPFPEQPCWVLHSREITALSISP